MQKRGKRKKAVSQIITTILIILLVLTVIVMIWGFVKSLVQEKTREIEPELLTTGLSVLKDSIFINEIEGKLQLSVSRGADDANLSAIKIVVYGDEGSRWYEIQDYPKPLETKTYVLNISGLTNIRKVSVYPVSQKGNYGLEGKQDTSSLPKNQTPEGGWQGPLINPGGSMGGSGGGGGGTDYIAYWKFENNLNDETGKNNGTFYGGKPSYIERESGNYALEFDGIDDYVKIPDSDNLYSGMNSLTISFWLKRRELQSELFLYKNEVWGPYSFRSWGQDIRPFIRNHSSEYTPEASGVDYFLDIWFYYTFTYDGARCRQYINGYLFRDDECPSGGVKSDEGSLYFAKSDANYKFFNGSIDEVKIFNRALSQIEVENLFEKDIYCGDGTCSDYLENYLVCYEDCFDNNLAGMMYEDTDLSIWYADASIKVLPSFKPAEKNMNQINLNIAQNEARVIQLAITPKVNKEISFYAEPNNEFDISLYVEELVNISTPSEHLNTAFVGLLPDPLLKKESMNLKKDNTAVVLIEISSKKTTTPGLHMVNVFIDGKEIPITVEVYSFSLPDELTLKTAFDGGHFATSYTGKPDCNAKSVLDFHNINSYSPLRLSVAKAYYDDYAKNRIVPYHPHIFNDFTYDCNTKKFNFTEFDKSLEYYLDELHMNAVMIFHYSTYHYNNAYPLCGYNITQEEYPSIAIPYYSNLTAHLRDKGWLDKSYIMVDEPSGIHLNYTRDLAYIITHNVSPSLKIGPAIYDEDGFSILNNSVNLWIMINNNPKYILTEKYAKEFAQQGDEIWWYYTQTSIFDIDSESIDNLVFPWLAWKYNVSGILTWAGLIYDTHCLEGDKYNYENPWYNPRSIWGNGQINFYYPPCKDMCTEPTFDVVPSLRLKLFREGLEDYEYFRILRDTIKEAKSQGIDTIQSESTLARVDEIALSPTSWDNDASLLVEIREEVARSIEDLKTQMTSG